MLYIAVFVVDVVCFTVLHFVIYFCYFFVKRERRVGGVCCGLTAVVVVVFVIVVINFVIFIIIFVVGVVLTSRLMIWK